MRKLFNKRFVAILLTLAMVLSLVPVMAFADDGVAPVADNDALQLSKNTVAQADGSYTITLEAYSTGTVTHTTVTKSVPLDIVLVLDQSGSMAYDFNGNSTNNNTSRRQYAMKNAVNAFIDNVASHYDAEEADHRISIVTFGSNASTRKGWTNVSAAGAASLKDSISTLPNSPSGATNVAAGMATADSLLPAAEEGRNQVVIVFTDGVPTTSSEFSTSVATNAINNAKSMKDDGVTVYTIGIFTGVNAAQLHGDKVDYALLTDTPCDGSVGSQWGASTLTSMFGDVREVDIAAGNRFLNYLSSNFANSNEIGIKSFSSLLASGWEITKNFDRDSSDYYLTATDAESLNAVFAEISSDIQGSATTTTLDSEAVLKDILSDDFVLPEGYNANSSIKVQLVEGTYVADDAEPAWGTVTENPEGIVATADVENGTVSVTGYNYKEEYIAEGHPGTKLVVIIEGVELDSSNFEDQVVDTNKDTSGIYSADDETAVLIRAFEVPEVKLAAKSYVVDYAKSFVMDQADWSIENLMQIDAETGAFATANTVVDTVYGEVTNSNGVVTYAPQTMQWDGADVFYAFGEPVAEVKDAYNPYIWSKVEVVPASSVYYEDTFVTSESDGVVGIEYGEGFTVSGEGSNEENPDTPVDGGWMNSDLSDDTGDSDGTAHVGTKGATATFTFTGTGVDVYSRTDIESGMVTALLYKEGETQVEKLLMIDNLAVSGVYYNVPTLSFQGLDYGTYTVKLGVTSAKGVEEGTTRSTYYLDGIRVYNPMGVTVNGLSTVFTEVRDLVAEDSNNAVFTDWDAEKNEAVAAAYDASAYEVYGPKNEVYLAEGQAITFKVEGEGVVSVGMKSLTGAELTVNVSNGEEKASYTVSHSADLFYAVKENANGLVTIQNTSEGVLALTKVQLVSAADAALASVDADEAVAYVTAFAAMPVSDSEVEVVVPEVETETPEVDVEIENPQPEVDPFASLRDLVKKLFNQIFVWF